jgi:hypothetical protein
VVGVAVATGDTATTPDHLLDRYHVAWLEESHLLAELHHLARELVSQDGGELGEAGVEDVVFVIGLVEVHVGAAHAASLDLQ